MKTQELLELAALDALGLLDEAEREAFDIAFRAAPPALQAQIRREQTRIAGDDSLLPKIEAPMGLKARVLAAWREAVEAVSERSPARRLVGALTLMPSRGVSPFWRAGAIGCAAASVVLAVVMFNIRSQFDTFTTASNQLSRQEFFAKELGPRFQKLFTSPTTKHVAFVPTSNAVKVQAQLMIDPETNTGLLYACQLPDSPGGYALVRLDENDEPIRTADGKIETICKIHSSGEAGSAYNDRIQIKPGEPVGLIKADDVDETKMTLLLRGRSL
jgi:hypothetical protein